MWVILRRILKLRILSGSPIFTVLLGCIILLQTLLILQPCSHINTGVDMSINSRGLMSMEDSKSAALKDSSSYMCCSCEYSMVVDKNKSLVFKTPQRDKAFLTIGVPTINRTGDTYLLNTIESLVSSMSESEKKDVIILIFLADTDQAVKSVLSTEIMKKFQEHIVSGLIQLIQAPASFYPNNHIKRLTYGQGKDYVQWRAKQNYDYAFMFKYAKDLSTYYMQIEDDVHTRPGYISSISEFIKTQDNWICLEFSELGFIGKLYRTEHMERLAVLLMMFYTEQPVDYTFLFFNNLMTQFSRIIKIPTLFQHMGLHSSFPGKLQRLKDKFFDNTTKLFKGDNPPADISTSLSTYLTFIPKLAYVTSEGFFWSHGGAKNGDTFTVIFQSPQRLKRVVVMSGTSSHPDDRIYEGNLVASLTLAKSEDGGQMCTNDIEIGTFVKGNVDNANLLEKIAFKVMCLRITITRDQNPWVIVKEIAVFI
ncbi:alpha-1,6-mannosyl-glycoprotein 4-beta-N-acetylglucosaminyltransferase [Patella vulgata]|uniref:alpha-1,6-mannosyl-glycoprotein 4-beta-N-acetylglucosaminyltransferase n=1 Tax=Patella vulgata TaxID=6465 RepID=UPI00217FAA82|nr:alpha-1,6-mannosyl-glycoprotein 4-beta-N-acetylglucosaminyltransferase [Patella vulgata]XP_050407810.1 alpha-1,6-mannosyl-glycoprotein 4-beta-N-acetylglucosaminyltransferase [Patella vulgata]XP_050407811.1 alpha-1,6-mannosyl-glycoprotein 4-beta-N-acetylglucosaminyltransferase [Patella vulgata]XP_050407812.1 alpha-1,6-mannosyl-glycoprotein 4-beta-N-acetylglucosaminyltransferase [Patella vulgata]